MKTLISLHRLGLTLVILVLFLQGCQHSQKQTSVDGVYTKEILSKSFQVDGLYTSMAGPNEDRMTSLLGESRELLWIVGYEATVLKGEQVAPERFMCHASLDQAAQSYSARMAPRIPAASRLFTLSQGVTKVDFPEGFGLPVASDQVLWVRTQVLNLDAENLDGEVRFRVRIRYRKDSELESPMKALFLVRAPVVKALDPNATHFGGVKSTAGCSVGLNANPENHLEYDSKGQAFIPHWKVKQGRETTKTMITERLGIPDDMRIHTIVTHVHPSAESLTLVDLTKLESVYRAGVKSLEGDKLGIAKINTYSSAEGLLLKKEHDYGLISVYDNQTDRELDSMAVMYLYIHDPDYVSPTPFEMGLPLPPKTIVRLRLEDAVEFLSEVRFDLAKPYYEGGLGKEWTKDSEDEDSVVWKHKKAELLIEREDRQTRISLKLD